MAVEDESKRYYEPKAPGEKDFWMKHVIQKYTHPVAPDDQFTGGTEKDTSRKLDTKDYRTPNTNSPPKYLESVKRAIMGIREQEEVLDEAFPPKKKEDGDKDEDDKKKKSNPFAKDGDDDGKVDADGDGKDDEEEKDGDFDKNAQQDGNVPLENDGQDDTSAGAQISGDEVKQQLETVALQAAEMFAEIDEQKSFDSEVKDALDTITEALGRVSVAVTGDDSDKTDNGDKDEQGNDKSNPFANNDQTKSKNVTESIVQKFLRKKEDAT